MDLQVEKIVARRGKKTLGAEKNGCEEGQGFRGVWARRGFPHVPKKAAGLNNREKKRFPDGNGSTGKSDIRNRIGIQVRDYWPRKARS